ncbi:hypothetical protein ACIQVO_36175 [Streptomyces sp. NPDC101062]|uniref:hypothetical protein n=1 Tax=unclassified Streptomyces TaxID=2593676 RepID=UPI00382720EB
MPQPPHENLADAPGYVWIMSRGERSEGSEGSEVMEVFTDPAFALDEFAAEAKRQGFPRSEKVRVMLEFHLFERGVDYLELRRHPVRQRAPHRGQASR